jgi:uncharacterized protein YfkK (UPF0435 family)
MTAKDFLLSMLNKGKIDKKKYDELAVNETAKNAAIDKAKTANLSKAELQAIVDTLTAKAVKK